MPDSTLVHAGLAVLTVLVTTGVGVSLQNRSLLVKANDALSNLDGRTKVLEDWRLTHEHWKEQQMSEVRDKIATLEARWDGIERRTRPRRGMTEE